MHIWVCLNALVVLTCIISLNEIISFVDERYKIRRNSIFQNQTDDLRLAISGQTTSSEITWLIQLLCKESTNLSRFIREVVPGERHLEQRQGADYLSDIYDHF